MVVFGFSFMNASNDCAYKTQPDLHPIVSEGLTVAQVTYSQMTDIRNSTIAIFTTQQTFAKTVPQIALVDVDQKCTYKYNYVNY